jgi:hypothetical protein
MHGDGLASFGHCALADNQIFIHQARRSGDLFVSMACGWRAGGRGGGLAICILFAATDEQRCEKGKDNECSVHAMDSEKWSVTGK